jgi:hypothetical protein
MLDISFRVIIELQTVRVEKVGLSFKGRLSQDFRHLRPYFNNKLGTVDGHEMGNGQFGTGSLGEN